MDCVDRELAAMAARVAALMRRSRRRGGAEADLGHEVAAMVWIGDVYILRPGAAGADLPVAAAAPPSPREPGPAGSEMDFV